jgi:L-alanine-DL-glutamate epimerase-like enolase superfamily enzyme
MRINRIESFGDEWVAFVRVRTDDGAEGWGQVAPYNADITTEVLHRQVAPHALGMDPLDPGAVAARVFDAEHKFPGSYVCRALAGVDTALWDLRGRVEGVGVSELLGSPAGPIDAYASSMRRDIAPVDEARRLADLRERRRRRRAPAR